MEYGKLRVGIQSLLGYLPAIFIKNILDGEIDSKNLPYYYKIETVSLYADISGFSKLSESFAKKGRIGPEFLAFTLNRYMEQLRKNGGDIFKFAGDAVIVIWPQTDNFNESCFRAIQCALQIQNNLNNAEISPGKFLSVKIGIGFGDCNILVVGGTFLRCEYLCIGEALAKAFNAESNAIGGETICSENVMKNAMNHRSNVFLFEEVKRVQNDVDVQDNFFKIVKMNAADGIKTKSEVYLIRTRFSIDKLREKAQILKAFVPAAIVKYLDIEKESWSKEIRMLGIMFLNLNVDLSQTGTHEGIQRIQSIVQTVQKCVYRTRGALNKFLIDNKGSVMVICWGIPPMSSQDDHIRCVESGFLLIEELKKYNCGAYIGVTTGSCFAGVCGTVGGRREYSLLGEMVNLCARNMQKAKEYANYLSKIKNRKINYMMLIDENTKELIQNKIFSRFCFEDKIKGFNNKFKFYKPVREKFLKYEYNLSPFPEIRSHKDNIPIHKEYKDIKKEIKYYEDKSLFMVGRNKQVKSLKMKLNDLIYNKTNDLVLVRGIMGSGKSLFIRYCLTEIVEYHKDLRPDKQSHKKFFISFQSPKNLYDPMNGWKLIFKEMYQLILTKFPEKKLKLHETFPLKMGSENLIVKCDFIGKIIFNSGSFPCIRYIEEILDTSLSEHYEAPEHSFFKEFYKIKEIGEGNYLNHRKFEKFENSICTFFYKLIKSYYQLINEKAVNPLIFVIEDCHLIDEISFILIQRIKEKNIQGVFIICSYQEAINPLTQNDNKLNKLEELFDRESTYLMDTITDYEEASYLILNYVKTKEDLDKVHESLINIILTKAFKGSPLFIIDIAEILFNSNKYIDHKDKEAKPKPELLNMVMQNDWTEFHIPYRIEKVLGSIVDSLDVKEIILLKHASVIGNLFDIDKLFRINPFNNVPFAELYSIIQHLENHGILEILYDLQPKRLVCKFAIPFLREICYQRMLIEQRTDIHLSVAKLLQNVKFSYIPHEIEMSMMHKHLKITEKSIINYMEDDNYDIPELEESKTLNKNNMKIVLVRSINDKLKSIHLRLDEQILNTNPKIIAGEATRRSSNNISWKKCFVLITTKKFIYWNQKIDYENNQIPIGWFYIKNIYLAQALPDKDVGFYVHVSSYYRKELIYGSKNLYFTLENKEEVYKWIVTLNFLKIKEIYNEFTIQYGTINLPLNHEIRKKFHKNIKKKFQPPNNNNNTLKSSKIPFNYYNMYTRKSCKFSTKSNVAGDTISIMRRQTHFHSSGCSELNNDEYDLDKKAGKLKLDINYLFSIGILTIIGYIQDIIFNPDNIELFDDKIIKIPKFLSEEFYLKKKSMYR